MHTSHGQGEQPCVEHTRLWVAADEAVESAPSLPVPHSLSPHTPTPSPPATVSYTPVGSAAQDSGCETGPGDEDFISSTQTFSKHTTDQYNVSGFLFARYERVGRGCGERGTGV